MINALIVASLLFSTTPVPDPVDVETPSIRIGLALSGGAALGLAHIGVLKVLEREGIEVCCIAGNSMGSLVGGLYAAGYRAAELESIAVHADFRMLFSSSIPFGAQYLPERQRSQRYVLSLTHRNFIPALSGGLVSLQNVEFLLMRLLSDIEYNTYYEFDSLPIPYRAIAVDLISGELIVLKNVRVEQAIRASIAIPGVFAPERIDSLELVDGGVQRFLPVEPLIEFEPDLIIASITRTDGEQETGIELIDVISRTMNLINLDDFRKQTALAHVVVRPDVNPFLASDFSRARELIAAGEKAAENMLPLIKEKIANRKPVAPGKKVAARSMPIIASIWYEGLATTRPSVLSSVVRSRPGTRLNFGRLIDDMVHLYNTGLFLNVNYRLEPLNDSAVNMVFELQEQDYGFYNLGIKYDNADNLLLGLAVGQGNLWGSGASVRTLINVGNPREIRLGLTGTRIFRFPFGYRLDLFRGAIDRVYYESGDWQADYKTDYYGSVAEVGYILGRDAFFNLGFDIRNIQYRLPELPVFDTIPEQEWVIGPTFNLEFNNFDDLQLPTKGTAMCLSMLYSSKALNADHEFLRLDFSLDNYLPISSRLILHPGIDLGISFGEITWSHYFFTDPRRLIGFEKEEHTTQQLALLRLGFDYKLFHLLGQENYPFYLQLVSSVATFTKLADLTNSPDFTSQLYWGVGIGARADTPIGPFHLILGAGDHGRFNSEDVELNYHISIGREFRYTK
jgi:NTE family protein